MRAPRPALGSACWCNVGFALKRGAAHEHRSIDGNERWPALLSRLTGDGDLPITPATRWANGPTPWPQPPPQPLGLAVPQVIELTERGRRRRGAAWWALQAGTLASNLHRVAGVAAECCQPYKIAGDITAHPCCNVASRALAPGPLRSSVTARRMVNGHPRQRVCACSGFGLVQEAGDFRRDRHRRQPARRLPSLALLRRLPQPPNEIQAGGADR